ncbi:MAG TPA: Asp-tRNA(Asn)/Glu-tRNA(Gln) amidotransferase subunit GatA, partial [Polyangiales bacterium]|nr:Asp-tRNA(Asn)/Glu-tRNA(Gln) amidotransferase subunit GatA [Polyangiales bacterium]
MRDLFAMRVTELASAVASGELSAVEITRATLDRVAQRDAVTHAYLHVDREGALQSAAQVDAARQRGEKVGLLAGVPIGVKDCLCTRGLPTTCASKILEGYVPPYDAHVVERIRAAGGVVIGKLNMDEFAMGSSNENSAYGTARNPWDPERTPGGSSGGAAAATAEGLAAATLGSDTGGSVRQPGSYCGVTAIKPTYGRVSRYGLIAFASSLDQVGPLARNVRDAARVLGVIAGHDPRDATSVTAPVDDYEAECGKDIRGLRVGVVKGATDKGCDASVVKAFADAQKQLSGLGCELVEVELPHQSHALSVYYIIAPAEASSNLARFDGMRYGPRVNGEDLRDTYARTRGAGFGPEVKRRIMLGTYALSAGYYDAFYLKAQKVRTLIVRDYQNAFAKCDVLI